MVAVIFSAFEGPDNPMTRCFPESEPESHQQLAEIFVEKSLADPASRVIIASESEDGPIAGWAHWVRNPGSDTPAPSRVFTADMFPKKGDGAFAARYFQANHDARLRLVEGSPYWFLSMLAVNRSFKRRGVGALLTTYGTEAADREGWVAYVNGSEDAVPLYEKFGFRSVEISGWDDTDVKAYHMKRDAKGSGS